MMLSKMFLSAILLGTGIADAQTNECASTYNNINFVKDSGKMRKGLKGGDVELIVKKGQEIEKSLLCLSPDLAMNSTAIERMFRFISYGYFLSNQKAVATKWLRAAQEASIVVFDERSPESEELRTFYESVRVENPLKKQSIEGKLLNLPEGTTLYLNGHKLKSAEFSKGQKNIVYLLSTNMDPTEGAVLNNPSLSQGSVLFEDEFPSQYLKDGSIEIYDGKTKKIDRLRPPEKTPLMIVGGVTTLAALGLYGYTFKTNQDFAAATTPEDLKSIQTLNNNLVITAGIVGFLGFGMGYTGILIDDKGGIRF